MAGLMDTITGLLIGGEWRTSGRPLIVHDKYHLSPFAELHEATEEDVDAAVAAAVAAPAAAPLSPYVRSQVLERAADLLGEWSEDIVASYVAETGFTVADARTELARTRDTVRLSAGEARRLGGEVVPVEATPGSEHRIAFTRRVPVGVVAAIAPFNAPLNTVAHKVAPAIAAGNAVVLKPATATPLCSAWLCQALRTAGLPDGWLNMVVGPGSTVGARLVEDRRVRYFTFTGSTEVGLWIKQHSGIAKTHLELGANSATIVCDDARLEKAADLIVRAGFRKAGQVCTSVQRVLADGRVIADLEALVVERTRALAVGDPHDAKTDVGAMISVEEAERAISWVAEATKKGARKLTGGEQDRAQVSPVVLADVPVDARVVREEVFAPVVSLLPVADLAEAVRIANDSPYGLQAGVFTQDLDRAMHAAAHLQVGGVIVNDTSSYHADLMPYGGMKDSGYGVEGPRYAVEDMTHPRIVVLNLDPDPS